MSTPSTFSTDSTLPAPAREPAISTAFHRFSTAALLLWTLLWTLGNLAWLARDRLPRDGDEEGHVGAAELFRADLLEAGPTAFLHRLFLEPMGDYPSLYPALVGGAWALSGQGDPALLPLRALGLLWILIAAFAAARIAARAGPAAAPLAFLAATLLPLPVGLARHYMPEGLLVALLPLSALAALRLAEAPRPGRALALGLLLGLGLLAKQTLLPLLLPLLLWLLARRLPPSRWLSLALPVALLAGPFYARELAHQLDYLGQSATQSGEAPLGAALLFHPAALLLLGLGPPLSLLLLPGLRAARRPGPARLAALLLLGGLLLFTLVPKKYPRLLAPVGPLAAVLIGVGWAQRPRLGAALLLLGGGGWLGWRSLSPGLVLPAPLQQVVPGCPQHWLRAPVDDDLGLSAVAARLASLPPGPVRVLDGPEIPCELQTTAPWAEHLGPYLRRTGRDREVLVEASAAASSRRAVATVRFRTDPPDPRQDLIPLPRLGGALWVEIDAAPAPSPR